MPVKLCPKCSKPNGVRTHNCECGHSFLKKEKVGQKIKIVRNNEKDDDIKILTKNDPNFLQQMALGISVAFRFKWEEDNIDLVSGICACRPFLKREDVEEYCKLSLEELWKK